MNLVDTIMIVTSMYFMFVVSLTISRRYLGTKGTLFILVVILAVLELCILFNLNNIILCSKTSSFYIKLTGTSWLLMDFNISLKIDALSYFYILLIVTIGFCTNMYSLNYFKYEANEDLFILLLNWFMLSMILLVLANNLFTLFLG